MFDPLFSTIVDLLSSHLGGHWVYACGWVDRLVTDLVVIPSLLVVTLPLAKVSDFLFFWPCECLVVTLSLAKVGDVFVLLF